MIFVRVCHCRAACRARYPPIHALHQLEGMSNQEVEYMFSRESRLRYRHLKMLALCVTSAA